MEAIPSVSVSPRPFMALSHFGQIEAGSSTRSVQLPMPGLPIERSIADPSLLAEIIVAKYANHTPLYRQSEIAARDGVRLDRASMARWVGQCEELCRLLTEALRRYTMSTTKLHADDTPIPVLAPGNKKTRTGRLWVYMRDDRRFPLLSGSRTRRTAKAPTPRPILPDSKASFRGAAMLGFNELTESGKVRLASCWDHARRYLFDVHETAPSETTKQWLDMIGDPYEIETAIRGRPPDERRRVRREKSSPLLVALESSMKEKLATLWPKAPLVEAINYSLNRWGLASHCSVTTAVSKSATCLPKIPCAVWPLVGAILYSRAPAAVVSELPPCMA
ncbi:IS66 family transposase [Paraburkholderia phymatum]|uniref:IS66 family transposase n=1 Tax=Paraburkholderia phymatum TaxID=148447 RepID=UPI00316E94D3